MPDLAEWNPIVAAKLFVEERNRRHREITPANETTRRQSYFKGVFPEARECVDTENDSDLDDENTAFDNIFDF